MRVLLVVVAVVVLAVLGSGVGVVAYEPLREGSYGRLTGPSKIEDQRGVGEQARVVTYESGREMIVEFSIRNEGPLGVTITGIPSPTGGALSLFEVIETRRGVEQCCAETEPFAPFELGRNGERFIQLRGILKGCGDYVPGSSIAWSSYPVRYRILGVSRTQLVHTRSPVIIEIPADFKCSEPPTYPTP
jgi:hypothetical protein